MLIRTPESSSTWVKRGLVDRRERAADNWLPWSVLKISGLPKRAEAKHLPHVAGDYTNLH